MNENSYESNTVAFPSNSCLHEIFSKQASLYPNRNALIYNDRAITFADLDNKSLLLAMHLCQQGFQPEDFGAIYLERSFEMVVAIFGILKAGGAYVPIDVNYPADRVAFMLKDANAKVVLTQTSLLKKLPETQATVICLDTLDIEPPAEKPVQLNKVNPGNLAYMIYTSGSTGMPKGCMITHENLFNQLEGQQAIAPEPIGAMILTVSISFDVSVLTIFWTLLQGATLVLPKQGDEKDPGQIAELIWKNKVTHSMSLPSPYSLLLDQAPSEKLQSLRLVNVSGEVCPTALAQKHERLLPYCQLYNLYGPTEATVNCTFFKFPKGFNEPKVPIGIPIKHYEIFILNDDRRPVAPGETGEIYIGGTKPVVGRGYWNRPELTVERFVNKPEWLAELQGADVSTLYKTGDLARWLPDGNIEFLGRADFQVKYRGFRVELGEIETAIGQHPAVKETVVLLNNPFEITDQRLVAYVTLEKGQWLNISDLRKFLEPSLPEYMLPSHLVVMDKMPLTTNGKYDRQALPEPTRQRPDLGEPYECPSTDLEKSIAATWERLLGINSIGRNDKFFELGGTSILAAKFIGELLEKSGESIFITTIFDHPTVAAYAVFLEKNYPKLIPALLGTADNGNSNGETQRNRQADTKLTKSDFANFSKYVPIHLGNHKTRSTTSRPTQSPIFILAPPRSGTTLLRAMLAGHPGLFACNELQLLHFETLMQRQEAYTGKFSLWSEGLVRVVMELQKLNADDAKLLINNLAEQGMTTLEMYENLHGWLNHNQISGEQSRLIVDKSPSYALDRRALEKALSDFPEARFIHLVRHPYSMVRSFVNYHMDQVLYLHEHDYSPAQLGELVWQNSHHNTIDFLKNVPQHQQFRLLYEDLVQKPGQAMNELCSGLGLPFHENLLSPYRDLNHKMTDGIYAGSRSMGDTHFDQMDAIDAKKAQDWEGVLKDNFLSNETWELAETLGYEKAETTPGISVDAIVANQDLKQIESKNSKETAGDGTIDIAIIGMACRLPGANNLLEFWQNLVEAKDVSHQITDEDLQAEGILNHDAASVKQTYALSDPYAFDATFFGYHPKEAEMTDPQHRILLELAHEVLETAGYNPSQFDGNIGIFGGLARNTYLTNNLLANKEALEKSGWYQEMLASDSSFAISRVAYKLNLKGPAVNVQTACSTGGVAVHMACQSLLAGDSDMVLVGGGRIQAPVYGGYQYVEGGPLSPDGCCRAFDEKANGMVQGHGMAILLLKKLDKAISDGDHVWAVIKSTAINNDGSDKTGMTAPSAKGQAAVIRQALEKAHLRPHQIDYIETHGTGTFIGDPIEIQGLALGMRDDGQPVGKVKNHQQNNGAHTCLIGSVKSNIGHLDAGAGIAGIIKTALSLYFEQLPATMHFTEPNPQLNLKNTPFEVNATLRHWPRCERPRRAGVSTFGLGGTNAHIILEEAPVLAAFQPSESIQGFSILLQSAKTEQALEKAAANLDNFFQKHPNIQLADAAYTLALGRSHFSKRKATITDQPWLSKAQFSTSGSCDSHGAAITFMFPGGGAQYVSMTHDLYNCNQFFRNQVDECFDILEQQYGLSIRELVFPKEDSEASKGQLEKPANALASLFTIEYSLARLWQHWGIQPDQMIGHSMGEYAAACLAGVMSLQDALGLVTVRGRLFETLDGNGGMLGVALTAEQLSAYLDSEHTISVINKKDSLVVSGTAKAIDRLQQKLSADGIDSSNVHIKVAAHSPQVEPILPAFRQYLEKVELREPTIPFISNVTGTWITPAQATSVEYWLSHLRQTVRFDDGLQTLVTQTPNKNRIFLEVGPGQTLSAFARTLPTLPEENRMVLPSARHPKEVQHDEAFILKSLAKLWVNGIDVDWKAFYSHEHHKRVPLPTYPFEKRKFFLRPVRTSDEAMTTVPQQTNSNFNNEKLMNDKPFSTTEALPSNGSLNGHHTDPAPTRLPILMGEIKQSLHELSGLEPAAMDESASFLELGFDSLFLSQAIIKFNHKFKLDLSFRVLFEEAPTIAALAAHIDDLIPAALFQPVPATAPVQAVTAPAINSPTGSPIEPIVNPILSTPVNNLVSTIGASAPAMQQIIQQQLQIMQQQLAMMQGQGTTQTFNVPQNINGAQPESRKETLPLPPTDSVQPPAAEIQRQTKGVTAKLNSYKKIAGGDDLSTRQRKGLDNFITRYTAMTQQSKDMAQRHRQWYADPRSVTGFSKLWKEICYQIAHERSKGSKIWDVDGNEYIDYVMSYGVALFGHMPDFVEEAVAAAIKKGNSIDLLPPEATEVARIICELSGHDRATLANTGTEAVLGAVRAARTATGRDKIAVFDTDYHGMIDQFMVRGIHLKGESKTMPSSPGVPKFLVENTLVLDYDDPEVLQKLEKHIHELAAVVIEPVQAQNPHWQHPELIRSIRQMTEKNGVALIFDEIINGFRLNQRGAQAWYGVEADICAYGKSISGGLPLAAIAGKAKYMEAFDGGRWNYGDDTSPDGAIAYFASTFIKNPISVAAAYAALKEIERLGPAMQEALNEKTIKFAERIREIFLRMKAPFMIQSASSFFMIKNADNSPLTRLFNYFLRARGVNIRERPCFISTAHTEADFEKTYQAFELAIGDMFEAGLLEPWEGEDLNVIVGSKGDNTPLPSINGAIPTLVESSNTSAPKTVSMTEGQQEIFLSSQVSPLASKAYNIATEIRLEGHLDVVKMREALQMLVDRHEALRAVMSEDGSTQTILPKMVIEIPFIDLSATEVPDAELQKLHDEEAEHLFDLQNGPLVRFKIVRMAERVHLIFIHVHHIICDGWSLGILTRELGEIYGHEGGVHYSQYLGPTKPLSLYAGEQAEQQDLPVYQKNEQYWLSQFADGVPVLDLPSDFHRPAVKSFSGAVEKISLAPEFVKQLKMAAARQGATFYVFMLAAYRAFLGRIAGQDDMVIGVAAAGHNLPGNSNLVAHAIGLLPVRTTVDESSTFAACLKTVRKQVLDAFDHQQFTFGSLVKKLKVGRNSGRNTLVSVAFNLDSPLDELHFGNLKATTRAIPRHYETFDTFINLKPLGDAVDFEWNFNTDLFHRESIRLRLAEFERFLHGLVEGMETPVSHLPILPDFEKEQLARFGQGEQADFPLHRSLHTLFEEQVSLSPDKVAVMLSEATESGALTYRELNQQANVLAKMMVDRGLKPGSFVGLCMERSLEMMVGIYGILKAGGAYVPIDPRNPRERIDLLLKDANCTMLLTRNTDLASNPEFTGEIIAVDSLDLSSYGEENETPVFVEIDSPAYVIYTSGSTGMPKGVAISHRNAVNTLFAINQHLQIGEKDKVYSVSSMSFDMSIPDYFLTLLTGATLVIADENTKKDGFALRDSLERHRPTMMQATPTTWRILMLSGWKGDKNLTAIAGGEGFPKELAAELAICCKTVWNGYGPTETTIYATYQKISGEHLAAVPGEFAAIGSPIANVDALILDKHGEPVPIGVPGELYIGGNGVAKGYLNRPELTERLFVSRSAPYAANGQVIGKPETLYYRTGDLVRYLPSGSIEFLGRIDNQVKIRGYRVELGEIEETIKQFPGVNNAAVSVILDKVGSQQLAGYIVWKNEAPSTGHEQLKSYLRSKLPGFMVPNFFMDLEQLPMNASLKVDRKALPMPDLTGLAASQFELPKTPGEKLLADVWKELLGVEKVSIHDDFFDLGGHSLAAVQMMAKVKAETGVRLPLTTLFQHSTVQKLAVQLNGFHSKKYHSQPSHPAKEGSLIPIREGGSKPALYLVHGGGLHVLFYQSLVKYLGDDQPIYALQAKGLNDDEKPLDNIEDMAAHYIREITEQNPEGPFCLAGYSLGGLIAWEMAKQLKEMGKDVPLLCLFDAVAKYEWAGDGNSGKWKKRLKKTGFNLSLLVKAPGAALEYKKHVMKMNLHRHKGKLRIAYRNSDTHEIEEGYLPFGKEVYEKSLEAYEKYKLQPLDIRVDLFKAKEQMFYLHDPELYGWGNFAKQGVRVHEISGNHLTLFDEPHGKEVADAMQKLLDEAAQTSAFELVE